MDGGGADRAVPPIRQGRLRSCSLTPPHNPGDADINLSSVFDVFIPIQHLWQAVIEDPLASFLNFLYVHFQTVPIINSIGAYGVAIIVLTLIIRVALSPLTQFQLVTQRKTVAEQRKLPPQVAGRGRKT